MDAGPVCDMDVGEPPVWEDDELTAGELAALRVLEGEAAGGGLLGDAAEAGVPDVVEAVLGAAGEPGLLSDAELVGSLAAWHAVAARAQGRELAATAELLRRRPPRRWDRRSDRAEPEREELNGEAAGGPGRARPVIVASREAAEEIALALTVTGYAAQVQAELAADLARRLPGSLAGLLAGQGDLAKVKVLAEVTQFLSDEDAGKVDALLSARLGEMTTGELKDRARRAVIRIDPAAAERRRARAERKARFVLWGNEDATATVAVERMPAQLAAAAKARVGAIARAARAAGMAGPLALLEAKVATGLLLDTLPNIPPPAGGAGGPGADGPDGGAPVGGRDPGPAGDGWDGGWPPDWPGPGDVPGAGPVTFEPRNGPGDEGEPGGPGGPGDSDDLGDPGDDRAGPGTLPWPGIPLQSGGAGPGCLGLPAWLRPTAAGRIRLTAPWRTLAGTGPEPGDLSWAGPITPAQARELAAAAAADPGAAWRVIVTDDEGHAIAVAALPARQAGKAGAATGAPGLVGEVTVTIAQSLAAALAAAGDARDQISRSLANPGTANLTQAGIQALASLLARVVTAASQAAAEAEVRAVLDERAGGCAHTMEAVGYQVPAVLRRWVTARDRTCRSPVCRQPAGRCDQDHSRPYHRGGRTCGCGLGSVCRHHHQLKQLPGWQLTQDPAGCFTWTTPAGLTYRKEPHRYPI